MENAFFIGNVESSENRQNQLRINKLKSDYKIRSPKYGHFVSTYKDKKLYELMLNPFKSENLHNWSVLDIGSGVGLSTQHLKDRVKKIFYLDTSDHMIKEGIKRGFINRRTALINDMNIAKL